MTTAPYQRARSAEAKAHRRAAILTAARTLLDRGGVEGTTLAALAAEAGVVKSGIYRYFESREDVLLEILDEEFGSAMTDFTQAIATLPAPADPGLMGRRFARICVDRPRFCLLITHLAPLLEQNVSVDRIISFKRGLLARQMDLAQQAAQTLDIPLEDAAFLINGFGTLVAGIWPVAHPAPAMEQALRCPDIAPYRIAFAQTLARAADALAVGVCANAARSRTSDTKTP